MRPSPLVPASLRTRTVSEAPHRQARRSCLNCRGPERLVLGLHAGDAVRVARRRRRIRSPPCTVSTVIRLDFLARSVAAVTVEQSGGRFAIGSQPAVMSESSVGHGSTLPSRPRSPHKRWNRRCRGRSGRKRHGSRPATTGPSAPIVAVDILLPSAAIVEFRVNETMPECPGRAEQDPVAAGRPRNRTFALRRLGQVSLVCPVGVHGPESNALPKSAAGRRRIQTVGRKGPRNSSRTGSEVSRRASVPSPSIPIVHMSSGDPN